eukprot:7320217-Alexandrium_andersonii.AAC.1
MSGATSIADMGGTLSDQGGYLRAARTLRPVGPAWTSATSIWKLNLFTRLAAGALGGAID